MFHMSAKDALRHQIKWHLKEQQFFLRSFNLKRSINIRTQFNTKL